MARKFNYPWYQAHFDRIEAYEKSTFSMTGRSRLTGKITLLTGGAGEIGSVVAKRFLEEGATVILTGRTEAKLQAACKQLIESDSSWNTHLSYLVMNGSDVNSLASGVAKIKADFGRIDILINNAGTAGALRTLEDLPIESIDNVETLNQSVNSLIGSPWLTTLACRPLLSPRASVINISTIFSHAEYYGRIPYVVPKAALNALSQQMAVELGASASGIRVNTVYPGPVKTERIKRVFSAMDKLKKIPEGTTESEILGRMILRNGGATGQLIEKINIAELLVYLGSDESHGVAGQNLEVTNGFRTDESPGVALLERPNLGQVDYGDRLVWIVGGSSFEKIKTFASQFTQLGARVIVTAIDLNLSDSQTRSLEKSGYIISDWNGVAEHFSKSPCDRLSVAILPTSDLTKYGSSVCAVDVQTVQEFMDREIAGLIQIAQKIETAVRSVEDRWVAPPTVLFFSDDLSKENSMRTIRAAAIRELIRVWRHEADVRLKQSPDAVWKIYHLISSLHVSDPNTTMNEWGAWLMSGLAVFPEIDLTIHPTILPSVNNRIFRENIKVQNICGLHAQKVALITGGAEGIGGEISRHLIISGARIFIAERHNEKLERIRKLLIEDCRSHGYSDPESRVKIADGVDVSEEKRLVHVVDETVQRYGKIDFVINNAGLAGAEQMVIDAPRAAWQKTLMGNFVSNYRLMVSALPFMKAQGSGTILNMSSYFGGYRHGWIPYTNRSDYAVSKAGQIAMAENLARLIGPDVQINTIAPGPVDGRRLNGLVGAPGLYQRRAKLVIENKMLNILHSICIFAERKNIAVSDVLMQIAQNDYDKLISFLGKHRLDESIKQLLSFFNHRTQRGYVRTTPAYLDQAMFDKLIGRLNHTVSALQQDTIAPQDGLVCEKEITTGANLLRDGILKQFTRQKMPTDSDLALSVSWNLAQNVVTGEVIYPTNGFRHDGLQVDANFRYDGEALPAAIRIPFGSVGKVLVMGDSMLPQMAQLVLTLAKMNQQSGQRAENVLVVVGSEASRIQLVELLTRNGLKSIDVLVEESLDPVRGFQLAKNKIGDPETIVSFPWSTIRIPLDHQIELWRNLPSAETFRHFAETHLTAQFSVAQIASKLDSCNAILVTGGGTEFPNMMEIPFIKLFAQTLRPLTLAAGHEAIHLPHKVSFYQVDGQSVAADFSQKILSIIQCERSFTPAIKAA